MNVYYQGQGVVCTGSFTDPATGDALTMTSPVTFTAIKGDGTSLHYVYGTDPQLTNPAPGVYRVTVTADVPGTWSYQFASSLSSAAAQVRMFTVAPSLPQR